MQIPLSVPSLPERKLRKVRFKKLNLLTARSVSGHFVPPMGSRKSPPKAGLAQLGWTRTPKNEP